MITVYSEKEGTQVQSASDCLEARREPTSMQHSYEEIRSEIQNSLKVFESVKWEVK